jgi:hypothetical protein
MTLSKKQLALVLALALLFISFILMLTSSFYEYDTGFLVVWEYSYIDITFGRTETILSIPAQLFAVSYMNLVPLCLILISAVLIVLKLINKNLSKDKATSLIIAIALVIAGVLLAFAKQFITPGNESSDPDYSYLNMTVSGIVIIILTIFAGGIVGATEYVLSK